MAAQPVLRQPELRSSVLRVLYLLREGGDCEDAMPDFRSGGQFGGSASSSAVPSRDVPRTGGSSFPPLLLSGGPAERDGVGSNSGKVSAPPRVGWHIPGGAATGGGVGSGPALAVLEPQILRDLLHALQGVSSSCFTWREAEGKFEITSSFALSRPVWHLCNKMLELAALHMRLCTATNAALEADSAQSLLHQALSEALREQLQDYYRTLALLMAKADASSYKPASAAGPSAASGGLTLRRLWAWLQGPLDRMRLLISLCDACGPLRGGALASAVYGCSRVGDALAREACSAILRRVVEPLLGMVRAWMTEGELRDPYGEFFVCADTTVPLEDLWTSMYFLDVEMVPCFVDLDLARKILLTGKSVNFIRLCCPGQEWLISGDGRPARVTSAAEAGLSTASRSRPATPLAVASTSGPQTPAAGEAASGAKSSGRLLAMPSDSRHSQDFPADDMGLSFDALAADSAGVGHDDQLSPFAALTGRVEQAALRTNQRLVSLMMDRYALGEHCKALRRFLLLGQGDFIESLMDIAGPELEKDAKELFRHNLIGLVDMAVRMSNAQFAPADTLQRLDVQILEASSGERGWDVFLLDYAVDSPLHVVFTPAAMAQYHCAFTFLWKLRRVSHSLSSCWRQHMALQRHLISRHSSLVGARAPELGLELRQTLHKGTMLRNEMQHFVQNISSYVMTEVIDAAWGKLQAAWARATDLDQVILEHQRYLSCIEEGAFLTQKTEAIMTALVALFGLALDFSQLYDTVCTSAFEAIETIVAEPDGPVPFARSLAECRGQLDQIGANFLVRLQALLRALEGKGLEGLSSDLRFLVCRLDFNGYYEAKRGGSVDVGVVGHRIAAY
eukprot:TRINITY_DN121102_c0_g1_i1.p1 TRINITY_DN121102_c0_g1~~TRINITY_DN121102_c0_g1_i1.p1  ORF type:complete len:982 (+),score=147.43 TRINITY_DN121102_c0_g1_i1:403-2946(+)